MEISITYLPLVNTLLIKGRDKAFLTTKDAVLFDRDIFIQLILAMVKEGYIDYQILEGLLEEFHTT
jgi:hypothetical protein